MATFLEMNGSRSNVEDLGSRDGLNNGISSSDQGVKTILFFGELKCFQKLHLRCSRKTGPRNSWCHLLSIEL